MSLQFSELGRGIALAGRSGATEAVHRAASGYFKSNTKTGGKTVAVYPVLRVVGSLVGSTVGGATGVAWASIRVASIA